jgi:hypothetical protein
MPLSHYGTKTDFRYMASLTNKLYGRKVYALPTMKLSLLSVTAYIMAIPQAIPGTPC